jgi:hypothetical protein
MTLTDIFPGRAGRVFLTRVAVRLRMPQILKMKMDEPLDPALSKKLQGAVLSMNRR